VGTDAVLADIDRSGSEHFPQGGLLLHGDNKDVLVHLLVRQESLSGEIIRQFRAFPLLPPPDERISACIVGVWE
jgi:hypothetical protein